MDTRREFLKKAGVAIASTAIAIKSKRAEASPSKADMEKDIPEEGTESPSPRTTPSPSASPSHEIDEEDE